MSVCPGAEEVAAFASVCRLTAYDRRHVSGRLDQLAAFCGGRAALAQLFKQWEQRRGVVASTAAVAVLSILTEAAVEERDELLMHQPLAFSSPAAASGAGSFRSAPVASPVYNAPTSAVPLALEVGGAELRQEVDAQCMYELANPPSRPPSRGPFEDDNTMYYVDNHMSALGPDPWSAWLAGGEVNPPAAVLTEVTAGGGLQRVRSVRNTRTATAPPRSPSATAVARRVPPHLHTHLVAKGESDEEVIALLAQTDAAPGSLGLPAEVCNI
eukprot:Hpha_TRINITY_DN23106_c0_g1::TRINITY_DN23106_c0_g1_i1::g.29668::m.29668